MNSEWFEKVIKEQIKTCEDVLIGKAKEYATDDDRLHNFKNAAGMMSCDPKEALAGMMAKHTISVYDMCRSGKNYPIELWNEKITDHINYLLLLKAIVEEDHWHETLGNEGEKYCNKMLVNEGEKIVKKLNRMAENSIYGLMATNFEFDGKPIEIKKQEISIDDVIKGLTICISGDCKDCPYNDNYCSDCGDKLKIDSVELLEKYKSIIGDSTSKNKDESELDAAISLINEYYSEEFNDKVSLTKDKCDLKHIGLAHTEYNGYAIQVDVDLVNFTLTTLIDNKVYKELKYPSLRRLIDDQLKHLDFDSLVAPIYYLDVVEEKTPKIKEDPEALDEAIKSFRQTLKDCATKCKYCYHLLDEFNNIVIKLKEEHHDNT